MRWSNLTLVEKIYVSIGTALLVPLVIVMLPIGAVVMAHNYWIDR